MPSTILMLRTKACKRALLSAPFLAAFALTMPGLATFAQATELGVFDGLTREMSSAEQSSAGLDRLTPAERQFLDGWLRARFDQLEREVVEVKAAAAAEVDRRVAEERQVERAADQAVAEDLPFEAAIVSPFDGWSGKTRFRLDNGQVWQQRHRGVYRHATADTQVSFGQNFLGGWEMTVLSSGRSISVKRLK